MGLVCGARAWLVETALARDPAMRLARANLSTRRLALEWEGEAARGQEFADLLAALGFRVAPFDPALAEDEQARREAELLRAMAVAGFAAANVMLLSVSVWSGHAGSMGPATRELLHWVSALVALPAIAFAGIPFFRSAARARGGSRQHGRSDLDRRHPCSGDEPLGDAPRPRPRVLRFRGHAALFPARGPLPRP